jgi:tRNA pseudouridine55 synthase
VDGVLVVDKPEGPTSFDVVRDVRRRLRVKKAGHTGTLDPMATGVLPICLGEATKVAGLILEGDKAYRAVVRLGASTDTLDAQGKVTGEAPVPALTPEGVEVSLARFRGTYEQVPPMYSAVKVAGRRLYELAREGKEIERQARTVTVHALKLLDLSASEITLEVHCSKGFFVRTLAEELGRALGTLAHLRALRRTKSGPFTLAQSLSLEALASGPVKLVSMADALGELPVFPVSAAQAARVRHGVPLEGPPPLEGKRLRVTGPSGELLAVAELKHGRLSYLRVLASAEEAS